MINENGVKDILSLQKKLLKLPIQQFRKYKARAALIQLTSNEDSKLKVVGDGLCESLSNIMSAEELELINLIEARRSFLLRSNQEISVIDYGAGTPNSKRTKGQMDKGVVSTAPISDICKASKSRFWGSILFKLVRKLQPSSCVELGSCVGISASYQATALKMNGKGRLLTLEGSPEIAKAAEQTLEILKLPNASVVTGPFYETLKGVLESAEPIDILFNDGHHDHDAVIQYFNEALPYLSDEAVIVIDDISWSSAMRQAWTEIEDDKRVTVSIDLQEMGIVLVGNNGVAKKKLRIPL
jgi:predicted O-methyltransferase YrrM